MSTELSSPTLPEALGGEYDDYYLQGHVEPALAVLAVVADLMNNASPDDARDFLLGGKLNFPRSTDRFGRWDMDDQRQHANHVLRAVWHYWAKPDALDDEHMIRCEPEDEGAEAWTRVKM